MRWFFALSIMLLLLVSLQACGRKGPLVLPAKEPPAKPAAPAPAPEKQP
jgi:predicted small lipoprotein YifL